MKENDMTKYCCNISKTDSLAVSPDGKSGSPRDGRRDFA
jgi:hypothetical protein